MDISGLFTLVGVHLVSAVRLVQQVNAVGCIFLVSILILASLTHTIHALIRVCICACARAHTHIPQIHNSYTHAYAQTRMNKIYIRDVHVHQKSTPYVWFACLDQIFF